MFVGGEFFDDPQWLTEKPSLLTGQARFLNGGRASLTVIADYLLDHGIRNILLPSYLCPSILDIFQRCGIGWGFYHINKDLSIDLADLGLQAEKFHAAYFINYFGFPHAAQTITALRALKASGMLLVEDNAQSGFPVNLTGDFAFNSLRKLVPFDGSYLFTDRDIDPYIMRYAHLANRRLACIRSYRRELREYLLKGKGSFRRLVSLYTRAEKFYTEDNAVIGDKQEREMIERQDWTGMCKARRANYACLLKRIASIPELTPIFPILPDDVSPLGMPVYVSVVQRDALDDYLGKNGIGLFIHWKEICQDLRLSAYPEASAMAVQILTLTCDQRTSRKQLDYLSFHLEKGISILKQ